MNALGIQVGYTAIIYLNRKRQKISKLLVWITAITAIKYYLKCRLFCSNHAITVFFRLTELMHMQILV